MAMKDFDRALEAFSEVCKVDDQELGRDALP